MDLDRGLQRIFRIRKPDISLSTLEQPRERGAEIFTDLFERIVEKVDGGLV